MFNCAVNQLERLTKLSGKESYVYHKPKPIMVNGLYSCEIF